MLSIGQSQLAQLHLSHTLEGRKLKLTRAYLKDLLRVSLRGVSSLSVPSGWKTIAFHSSFFSLVPQPLELVYSFNGILMDEDDATDKVQSVMEAECSAESKSAKIN